jgi:hypothetical protein
MKTESIKRIVTGTVVLLSLALTYILHPWWVTLAAFVGVNLLQSAFTNFCFVDTFLRKLGCGVESHSEARSTQFRSDLRPGLPMKGSATDHTTIASK